MKDVDRGLEKLRRELRRQWVDRHPEEKAALIKQYARLSKRGRPIVCTPSSTDPDGDTWGSVGKLIFDTEENAVAFGAAMRELYGDTKPLYVYPCKRSQHGHVHLTRQRPEV